MNKIIDIDKAIELSNQLQNQGKSTVLTGGCFDILHIGHIQFLQSAKKYADLLFVLLESDETVKNIKGINRPVNSHKNRAFILSSILWVDFIVLLPPLASCEYDDIICRLSPNVIATTKNDPNIGHKMRQAKTLNAQLVEVTERIKDTSTTKLITLL